MQITPSQTISKQTHQSSTHASSVPPPHKSVTPLVVSKHVAKPMAAAGMTSLVYYPINSVTHTMQLTNLSFTDSARFLLSQGPLRPMRGYSVALTNVALSKGVSFGINETLLSSLPEKDRTMAHRIAATLFSVSAKILICQPVENVKLLRQNGKDIPTTHIIKNIFGDGGVLRFWRSSCPAFARTLASHGPYLLVHGKLKDHLPIDNSLLRHTTSGLLAGLSTLPTALPFDHLKVHIIVNPTYKDQSAVSAIVTMLKSSAQEVGTLRTIGKLYHSTSGAALQITLGGIMMAFSMQLLNQLFPALQVPSPSSSTS